MFNIPPVWRLVIIGFLCALLVSGLYFLTHARIQRNQLQVFEDTLQRLVKDIPYDNHPLDTPLFIVSPDFLGTPKKMPIYCLKKEGIAQAYVFSAVAPNGYNGNIDLLIALNAQGKLLGLEITKHQETPGLGDYFKQSHGSWLTQFIGKDASAQWALKKEAGDFDAWSGATITPRAIVQAVGKVVENFHTLINNASP